MEGGNIMVVGVLSHINDCKKVWASLIGRYTYLPSIDSTTTFLQVFLFSAFYSRFFVPTVTVTG
jgi:hypothetical protein